MQQQKTGQQTSGQQPLMIEPPQVITTKDLNYLKDQLSWQLLGMKKCAHYAAQCTDPQVAEVINQAGRMHQRHYQILVKHFQTNNTEQMATVPQQS